VKPAKRAIIDLNEDDDEEEVARPSKKATNKQIPADNSGTNVRAVLSESFAGQHVGQDILDIFAKSGFDAWPKGSGGLAKRALLQVRGIDNWDLWDTGLSAAGQWLARKTESKNLRNWLRKKLQDETSKYCDGLRLRIPEQKALFQKILNIQHADAVDEGSRRTWADSAIADLIDQYPSLGSLQSWLMTFARHFRETVPEDRNLPTLEGYLTVDKQTTYVQEMLPFFVRLGMDPSVDYKPVHLPLNYKLAREIIVKSTAEAPVHLLDRIVEWLTERAGLKSLDGGRKRSHLFRELVAERVVIRQGNRHVLSPIFKAELASFCSTVICRMPSNLKSAAAIHSRVPLMGLLFDDKLCAKGHVWAGSFSTDGFSVCIRTLDLRTASVYGNFEHCLEQQNVDVTNICIWDLFRRAIAYAPSFATPEMLEAQLGRSYHRKASSRTLPDRKSQYTQQDLDRRRIKNAAELLMGVRPPPTSIVPQKAPVNQPSQDYRDQQARWQERQRHITRIYAGDRAVTVIAGKMDNSTEKGLPKWVKTLAEGNSTAYLAELKALHVRNGVGAAEAESWTAEETVRRSIAIGRDHGRIFPFVDGLQDLTRNRSSTFVVPISDLEHNRRRIQSRKSRVQNALKGVVADSEVTALSKTCRTYGKASYEGYRHRHSFDQRLAMQWMRWIWNLGPDEEPTRTNCKTPAVLFVGDECDFDKSTKKMTTFDASTSLSRTVMLLARSRGLPLAVFWVDEGFSSQVCFNPDCKVQAGPHAGSRELVFLCTFEETTDFVNRVVNCRKGHLTHRDANASFNIMQIGSILMTGGAHPWMGA